MQEKQYYYGQPGGPGMNWQPEQPKGQGFAIASFVLGLCSILLCMIYGGFLGIIGLILGIVSCVKQERGRGFAIAGIVTSVFGMLITIVMIMMIFLSMELLNGGALDDYMYDTIAELEEREGPQDLEEKDDPEVSEEAPVFAGKQFEAEDGSVIYFEEDGTFVWYQDDSVHDDNYFSGNYSVYAGEDAADYILDDLDAYGVTEEELEDYFDRNSGSDFYRIENFVCMTLCTEQAVIDGENQAEGFYERHYMGFYADGYYDAANMDSGEYAAFTER